MRFVPLPAGSAEAPQGLNGDPVAARRIATYAESIGLSQPLPGNFGGIGRNTHGANGQADFDWNVYNSTRINERILVQVRCEIYNVFNHHAFRDVNRNISNPGFGQYTTPSQSQRYMQVGALLRF